MEPDCKAGIEKYKFGVALHFILFIPSHKSRIYATSTPSLCLFLLFVSVARAKNVLRKTRNTKTPLLPRPYTGNGRENLTPFPPQLLGQFDQFGGRTVGARQGTQWRSRQRGCR